MKSVVSTFKIACIFIGTVVGAGLASGKEIYQFFSTYGVKSFWGIVLCFGIYVYIGGKIYDIANEKKLSSYDLIINEVCPKFWAYILNLFTSLYYLFSSAIIFAASGAIIKQFFSVHRVFGILLMIIITLLVLKFSMNGLFFINAISVPVMIFLIFIMFFLFEFFYDPLSVQNSAVAISKEFSIHNNLILSSFLYGGFNILSAVGVLAPLSVENSKKSYKNGVLLGAFFLVLISIVINYLILRNVPYIASYDIPLLYIGRIFGKVFQVLILVLIWSEMLSTETSSLYSLSKSLSNKFSLSFSKSLMISMVIAIPISVLGFSKLISIIYPIFGFLSFVFMIYVIKYSLKKKKKL